MSSAGTSRMWQGLLLLAAAGAACLGWREVYYLCDDALIAFRYVSNSMAGHGFVWNPPPFQPVEGYSSFLWVVLLRGIWSLTGLEPPQVANEITLLCGFGMLWFAGAFVRRMGLARPLERWRTALFGLVLANVALSHTFVAWLTSGLETALFNLLLTWWVYEASAGPLQRGSSWNVRVAAASALAALARPEGLLLAAAGLVMVLPRLGRRGVGAPAAWRRYASALPFLAVAAHLLWRRATYGAWLPNTYYAKAVGPLPDLGIRYGAAFLLESGFWLWFVLLALVMAQHAGRWQASLAERWRDRPASFLAYGVLAFHAACYTFYLGGDHLGYRAYSHFALLGAVSCCWLLSRLSRRPSVVVGGMVSLAAVGLPWGWAYCSMGGADAHSKTRGGLVSPLVPQPIRPIFERWESWLVWLAEHDVGTRCVDQRYYFAVRTAHDAPSRAEGMQLSGAGNPVLIQNGVGLWGWVLPNVFIIDRLGLNDRVVARTAPSFPTMVGHARRPPPGYVECFRPNVMAERTGDCTDWGLGYDDYFRGRVRIYHRPEPLSFDDIVKCESQAWVSP